MDLLYTCEGPGMYVAGRCKRRRRPGFSCAADVLACRNNCVSAPSAARTQLRMVATGGASPCFTDCRLLRPHVLRSRHRPLRGDFGEPAAPAVACQACHLPGSLSRTWTRSRRPGCAAWALGAW